MPNPRTSGDEVSSIFLPIDAKERESDPFHPWDLAAMMNGSDVVCVHALKRVECFSPLFLLLLNATLR